jgi:hypothetical protein
VELWGCWSSFGENWSVRPSVVFLCERDSITWDGEVGLDFSRMILGHGQEDNGCSLEMVQMKTRHAH